MLVSLHLPDLPEQRNGGTAVQRARSVGLRVVGVSFRGQDESASGGRPEALIYPFRRPVFPGYVAGV
jgi:hypothetical protein